MKTFREHIVESAGVTHAALLKQVTKMYEKHASGTDTHEMIHVKKNAHTGASKHWTGSVKAHTLAYRHKLGTKYVSHPMRDDVQALIKKHGGTLRGSPSWGDEGGFIDTSDGYRHHFTRQLGSNYNTFDHEISKKPMSEAVIAEDASDVHGDLAKIGFTKVENKTYDHLHKGSVDPEKMHDTLEKHGYNMCTHYARGGPDRMPRYAQYKKEHGYAGSENVMPHIKDGKVTHLMFNFSRSRD